MSRMKHILRRLHIGGGRPNDQSAEEARPNNSAVTNPNPSPPLFSSSPSSDMDPSSTPSPSPIARNRDVAADAPPDSSCFDSNFFEEEFQVQLALAISASDPGASLDVAETAQIKAAERISLISSTPSVPKCETLVEFLSLQYWNYNFINYDEKVVDGFYDVYGNSTNLVSQGKMPSLGDLQATSLVDDVGYEVIMVDRSVDVDLQMLDSRACCLFMESQASTQDPVISGLIQKIADLVVGRMGGPVVDAEEMNKRWIARSYELRKSLNTVILPLGYLDIGLSRHRAMLFKALADKINLPCMLVKGFYYTGTDEGAVNLIKTENGSEYIIDLMGAPGALIPAEVPTGHLQNFRSDAQSSAGTTKKDKNSCLELVKGSRTLVASPHLDNVPKVGSSELNYVGIQFKKADDCEVQKDRKERFEHDFGKLLPSLHMSCECSIPAGGESSHAQKMQVIDVSKYVISAAKNPEFAQKLHAVLLESGAIPPNLSIDINSHPNMLEQNPFVEEQKVNDGVQCPVNESVLNDNLLSNPSLPSKTTSEGYVLVGHEATGSAVGDVGQHFQDNAGINPVLGEVAEWEIPWEDLQIGERIGIGSYGEVYRADWNGTEVAVKKFLNQDFSGEALIQFIYEVELMIKLRHPNVVLFMGAVTRSPNSSILTEFLPRGSLYKLLHRTHIRINERRRVRMALDVAKGMNYLHTGHPPIVHRDLKSPNLLVDKNWVVKVCDFGLSRWKHHTFLSSKSTAGTAEWMAPEVLRNEPSNEKCDVYSFGVILWELTTLRVPWSGMNPMQVVGAVGFQNKRLEIPKEVDPMVAQIILDCWQTEPQLRPSFSQLISRLRLVQRLTVE